MTAANKACSQHGNIKKPCSCSRTRKLKNTQYGWKQVFDLLMASLSWAPTTLSFSDDSPTSNKSFGLREYRMATAWSKMIFEWQRKKFMKAQAQLIVSGSSFLLQCLMSLHYGATRSPYFWAHGLILQVLQLWVTLCLPNAIIRLWISKTVLEWVNIIYWTALSKHICK
jgi:hypothetical protein